MLLVRPTLAGRGRMTALLVLLVVSSGCAQSFDATTLGLEAAMAVPADTSVQGEPFEISRKSVYLLMGILPVSRPSLSKVLAAQVTGDARVSNLRIKVRSRFWDIVITGITGGLVVPRTVTYEGVIIQP